MLYYVLLIVRTDLGDIFITKLQPTMRFRPAFAFDLCANDRVADCNMPAGDLPQTKPVVSGKAIRQFNFCIIPES